MAIADGAAMPPKAFVERALAWSPQCTSECTVCYIFFASNEVDKVFGFTV